MTQSAPGIGRLVARNFLALGTGEVVARAIAFAATIYLARTLGPAHYGVIGFATAVLLYLSRIADFGIDLSGAREVAADAQRLAILAPSILTIRLLIAIGLVLATSLLGIVALPHPDGLVLAAYSMTLFAVAVGTRWIYYGLERGGAIAVTRATGEALMALLVVTLVRGPDDLLKAPVAQFGGDLLAALLLAVILRRRGYRLSLGLDWPAVRPLLRRTVPLVLAALLGLIIYNSDLIFLRVFSGTDTVGYYAAAYALVSLLVNLGLNYRVSLLPALTRLAPHPQKQKELYTSAMAHVFAVAIPIGCGGFLLAPQIIEIFFGAAYVSAAPVLQLLIWTVPLCLLRDVPTAALLSVPREDQVFRLTAWGAAINVGLNVLLIPKFGMLGAAAATVSTEAVRLCIAFALVHAHGFRVAALGVYARVVVAALAMTLLLVWSRPAGFWMALSLGMVVYGLALVGVKAVQVRWGELPALRL